MKRRTYPEYKDSHIEWVGEIPEHWGIMPLKRTFVILNGSTPKSGEPDYWDGEIPWATPDDLGRLKSDTLDTTRRMISQAGYESCGTSLAPAGSLVLSTRAPIGHLAIAGIPLCTNQGCRCLVFRNTDDHRFYYYQLLSAKNELESWGQGSTFRELGRDKLGAVRLLCPPPTEQGAIAAFLDRETARIDTLIEKKERQIDHLQEKRGALISHAVTKGLDPEAKMKDSGIEWLGEIPEHWEIKRLKYSAGLINQKVDGNQSELPYTGLEHIESWTGKRIAPNDEVSSERQANLYMRGDVLFGKLRPYLAKVHATDADGICTGELLVLRPKTVRQKFLLDYLLNRDVISIVDSSTYGAKMPRANWDFIGNLPVLIPPITEQGAIAAFLDRETARIDALIEKIRKSIDLLREYRTALITASVTGKIDVRGEVA